MVEKIGCTTPEGAALGLSLGLVEGLMLPEVLGDTEGDKDAEGLTEDDSLALSLGDSLRLIL